jgi:hypothetical protein
MEHRILLDVQGQYGGMEIRPNHIAKEIKANTHGGLHVVSGVGLHANPDKLQQEDVDWRHRTGALRRRFLYN